MEARSTPRYYSRLVLTYAISAFIDHTFNLTSLATDQFYDVRSDDGRIFHLNVCQGVKDGSCPIGTGKRLVCIENPVQLLQSSLKNKSITEAHVELRQIFCV